MPFASTSCGVPDAVRQLAREALEHLPLCLHGGPSDRGRTATGRGQAAAAEPLAPGSGPTGGTEILFADDGVRTGQGSSPSS